MATNNCINSASAPFTVASGNLTISAGNLVLSAGNLAANGSFITIGAAGTSSDRFIWNRGTNNTFLGWTTANLLFNTTNSTTNTFVGWETGHGMTGTANPSDSRNCGVGYHAFGDSGNISSTGLYRNVALGCEAMGLQGNGGNSNANQVVYIGDRAGWRPLGNDNVGIGYQTLQGASNYNETTGVYLGAQVSRVSSSNTGNAVLIGYKSFYQNSTRPFFVTTCGALTFSGRTGNNTDYSTALGYSAGSAQVAASNITSLLYIGANVLGTNGESTTLRIGAGTGTGNGQLNMAVIQAIYGTTVGATCGLALGDSSDQIGTISAASTNVLTGNTKPAWSAAPTGLTSLTATTLYGATLNTNVAAAALLASGTTISASGSNAAITIILTPKGAGALNCLKTYTFAVGGTNRAMYVDDSGNLGNLTSSRRFKQDIQDMALSSKPVMDLRPVSFTRKNDTTLSKKLGLIAEEVAEIMKCLVRYDDNGQPFTVAYQDLPAMLLNELQNLNRRVTELEGII